MSDNPWAHVVFSPSYTSSGYLVAALMRHRRATRYWRRRDEWWRRMQNRRMRKRGDR